MSLLLPVTAIVCKKVLKAAEQRLQFSKIRSLHKTLRISCCRVC